MTAPRSTGGAGESSRLWRQCIALAGALAEEGVERVDLIELGGVRRTLQTRTSDLPGTLFRCSPGSALLVGTLALRVDRARLLLQTSGDGSGAAARVRHAIDTVHE